MPKYEICAAAFLRPKIIEADNIDDAYNIALEMDFSDFRYDGLEITDVTLVEEE